MQQVFVCIMNEQVRKKITVKLSEIKYEDFDAVFYPGRHGPLWDLAIDTDSIKLIEHFYNHQKPIAFVCHSPAALINVKAKKW